MIRVGITRDEVTPMLDRLSEAMIDMTPVMAAIGSMLSESTMKRFQEGNDPDGNPWAPKTAATLAAYEKRKQTIDLRPLFGPSNSLNSTISFSVGADGASVEIGSNLIYSAVMQGGAAQGAFGRTVRGGPIPWGNIPARPFLGISEQDEADLISLAEEWLGRVAQGSD
ncbi:MAG: phage virion morphogenesis protein [Rhodobacterales bacterium]|nr:phage virion morphogenesis protein [Rhodobacterales bacterium]